MANSQVTVHRDKQILIADFSHSKPEEQLVAFPEIQQEISARPPKSVLLLTDVTGAVYNGESARGIKEWASKNTPFIKASAVVGATGFLATILAGIRLFTGRDIRAFGTREEAMEWLVSVE